MVFRRTNYNNRTTYTYKSVTGETITFAPEDANGEVTADLIKCLHSLDDKEVYNNIKNHKPQLSDDEKATIREWEKTHPREEAPKNWIMSLDAFYGDSDSDMDRSYLMREVYDRLCKEDLATTRLWEVMDDMPDKQRRAFLLVELYGYTMTEVADKLYCSIANVSKLVARAKKFIEKNYYV
ncbi:MAG: sigma-70 family RNA polymerase sigma factor [Lachnospiraceae bacterium]|jgi:RNA polymerase sigma factor (sigma-70 family)|nr:sigma-70 family RNA polymerase sigma factor [Lachnospiraceae bacterium]